MGEEVRFAATGVIRYLKEDGHGSVDVGDEVLKPCVLTNTGMFCRNDNFLQYKRRWPETIDSSTHYELQRVGDEISVVVHVEKNTELPLQVIRDRLREAARPDSGVEFKNNNLKCVERVNCAEFGSVDEAAEKAKGLLKKLYQSAEPMLRKIEEDAAKGVFANACNEDGAVPEGADDACASVDVWNLVEAEPKAILEGEYLCPLEEKKAQVVRVEALLMQELRIPDYQRPYKWSEHSVRTLLNDIEDLSRHPENDTRYRIGTVILLHENDAWSVVDGQQRIMTLILLSLALGLGTRFSSDEAFFKPYARTAESRRNIRKNFKLICDVVEVWRKAGRLAAIGHAFATQLEAVVLKVGEKSEAFQLFDCQNTRGRKLDPADLLKAFHLREVPAEEQKDCAETWDRDEQEARKTNAVTHGELFDAYFHRIHQWLRGVRPRRFSDSDIEFYKGVPKERDDYAYVHMAKQHAGGDAAMPLIDEPFYPGGTFFAMTHAELDKVARVRNSVKTLPELARIRDIAESEDGSRAFKYCQSLFYTAAVYYYDRFSNLDPLAVAKICAWAFMPRLDLRLVQDKSVIKYALGADDLGNRYTNHIAMFEKIRSARFHYEIADIQVELSKETADNRTMGLRRKLKRLLGL